MPASFLVQRFQPESGEGVPWGRGISWGCGGAAEFELNPGTGSGAGSGHRLNVSQCGLCPRTIAPSSRSCSGPWTLTGDREHQRLRPFLCLAVYNIWTAFQTSMSRMSGSKQRTNYWESPRAAEFSVSEVKKVPHAPATSQGLMSPLSQ